MLSRKNSGRAPWSTASSLSWRHQAQSVHDPFDVMGGRFALDQPLLRSDGRIDGPLFVQYTCTSHGVRRSSIFFQVAFRAHIPSPAAARYHVQGFPDQSF